MDNKTITLIKEDGTEELAEILFTYFSEEFNKNYVVLRIIEQDLLTAAIYEQTDEKDGRLVNIENDEEWELIENLINDYFEENDHECGCGCGHDHDCDCDCDHDHECDCEDHDCGCEHDHDCCDKHHE